ncbi:hypothetical protein KSP39_PZI023461 [Platanthera zijinensis]|uniref:RsdA/BaiN/AoA(So)-like insert domain-containing protein n=1 Tax=Platanthera zijinensis TaxID=2320716 RepID=A0AAP0AUC0_9ASPA
MLQDILSQSSFTPSLASPIYTSTSSIPSFPLSEPSIPSFSMPPAPAIVLPTTFSPTSAQAPLEHVDLSALADRLYELLAPKLTSLLETTLAPLLTHVKELSSELSSFSLSQAITSSGCLDSVLPESRQGEMPSEVVVVPESAPAFAMDLQSLLSVFDTVYLRSLPVPHTEDLSKAIVPISVCDPSQIEAYLKLQEKYIKSIDDLYDNPQSSESDQFQTDSDDSANAIAKKRKARSKAMMSVPPAQAKDSNDIPYYILHDCPISEPWMQYSKNQSKAMKKRRKLNKYEKGSSQYQPPPPPPLDFGSGSAPQAPVSRQSSSQSYQKYYQRGQHQRGYQSRRGQYRGSQRGHRFHHREGQGHTDSTSGPFPYKLKDAVVSRTPPTDSESINRYEPPVSFEDPENNPLSWTTRMKELAALDQIKKAREQGKDTSNITTLSDQRKKELEKYTSRKFFNPEDYMKLHPEAVVPRPRSQTSLGAEDDRRSKKEALNPNREIMFKKGTEKCAFLHGEQITLPKVKAKLKLDNICKNQPELTEVGPMLVTHWGLSGPVILRLSAWGARDLFLFEYKVELTYQIRNGSPVHKNIPAQRGSGEGSRHKSEFQCLLCKFLVVYLPTFVKVTGVFYLSFGEIIPAFAKLLCETIPRWTPITLLHLVDSIPTGSLSFLSSGQQNPERNSHHLLPLGVPAFVQGSGCANWPPDFSSSPIQNFSCRILASLGLELDCQLHSSPSIDYPRRIAPSDRPFHCNTAFQVYFQLSPVVYLQLEASSSIPKSPGTPN